MATTGLIEQGFSTFDTGRVTEADLRFPEIISDFLKLYRTYLRISPKHIQSDALPLLVKSSEINDDSHSKVSRQTTD